MKKHHAIHNLGAYAHAPKAEKNHPTLKAQTQSNTSKLAGKSAHGTGKKHKA